MAKLPGKKRAGDLNRHEDFNALLDVVRSLANLRGGAGVRVKTGVDGIVIALAMALKDRAFVGKITQAPPAGVLILPSQCLYKAIALDKGFEVGPVAPRYGRQVEFDEVGIYPAHVGDLCFILRNPRGNGEVDSELMVLRENPGRGPC